MKDLVFVIDMVNGFAKFGAMADPNIAKIAPAIASQIRRSAGVHFICDAHGERDLEMKRYPAHCIEGSPEAEIIDELSEFATPQNTTKKRSTNGFYALDKAILSEFDRFVITGCCTDICVLQFALALRTYFNENDINKDIVVPTECVATYDAPNHEREYYEKCALNLMRNAGILVI
ncbi:MULTISPECIES: cysteine hydrolase family protein [unclassified Campylobacter]|uniref:cysteine hydrolase family protein n=1 Tax=unclassified Campylobacter TaxID=2593542 RepID=UPI0022E9A0CB|nr:MULTISPECIES: isochorismatase family cysteine hydrolase [unclassified Campylobacter]MDA3062657.1 cysteine hydrolase [Campylobacter sp. JMF_14 EL1]MDA3074042.1 cysteine hydrolase [Campylobacter sp. JMF_10 EL2]